MYPVTNTATFHDFAYLTQALKRDPDLADKLWGLMLIQHIMNIIVLLIKMVGESALWKDPDICPILRNLLIW